MKGFDRRYSGHLSLRQNIGCFLMAIIVVGLAFLTLSAFGQDWLKGNEPDWVNRIWTFQYRCYVEGQLDKDGWAIEIAATEEAARKKFAAGTSGEDCRIIGVEKGEIYPR